MAALFLKLSSVAVLAAAEISAKLLAYLAKLEDFIQFLMRLGDKVLDLLCSGSPLYPHFSFLNLILE